jgi:hypothetical protein
MLFSKESVVARVIRFSRNLQGTHAPGGRFPRFEEVGAQIDAQACQLFDSATSLAQNRELYARVELRLAADDRPLLRQLYQSILAHQEYFERAAYLVGLRAGAGRLEGLPPVLPDERAPEDPQLA